jgi:hypothetical protein
MFELALEVSINPLAAELALQSRDIDVAADHLVTNEHFTGASGAATAH